MHCLFSEIIAKYRVKCDALKEDIKNILEEEYQERQLNKLENQTNRAEKILKGETSQKRDWFQTKQEREVEKGKFRRLNTTENLNINRMCTVPIYLTLPFSDRLKLTEKAPKDKPKAPKVDPKKMNEVKTKDKKKQKKKKSFDEDTPEGRVQREMEKVSLLQARLAKRKHKQKKISTVYDKQSNGTEKG